MAKRGRPPHPDILTPREWEVLALLRDGLSNEEVAERLGVSVRTARYHVSEILGKLDVRSRKEAVAWATTGGERRPWWATAVVPVGFVWRKLPVSAPVGLGTVAMAASIVLFVGLVGGLGFIGFVLSSSWAGESVSQTQAAAEANDEAECALSGEDRGESSAPASGAIWTSEMPMRAVRSLASLVGASDVILLGNVSSADIVERQVYVDNPFPHNPGVLNAGKPPVDKLPVGHYRTKYVIQVDRYLKTDDGVAVTDGSASAQISVTDLGAIEDAVAYDEGDSAFYNVGERYLIFLSRHHRDPAKLVTAVGRHSQFVIEDGCVRPGSGMFPFEPDQLAGAAKEIQGLAESEVVSRIEALLGSESAGP